jgi:citrate lyase beta subunit
MIEQINIASVRTNMKNEIYHFANSSRYDIAEFAEQVYNYRGIICFDLEDQFMELEDTKGLHSDNDAERIKIIESILHLTLNISSDSVGVRVNRLDTNELLKDIYLLRNLPPNFCFNTIFLPKITSAEDVLLFIHLFKTNGIRVKQVIPIIETWDPFDNIENILNLKDELITRVAFGHCDYNLSLDLFPFYHQDSNQYWKWVNQFQPLCQKNNIKFINSPCLQLKNIPLMLHTARNLNQLFPEGYGQVTLSMFQTKTFRNAWGSDIQPQFIDENHKVEDKIAFAISIVERYTKYQHPGSSISVDSEDVLISLQEYISACRYLDSRRILHGT